jgi:hypothetical protein
MPEWQQSFSGAAERHAQLFYRKARESFDITTKQWKNFELIEHDYENLVLATNYFGTPESNLIASEIFQVSFILLERLFVDRAKQVQHQGEQALTNAKKVISLINENKHDLDDLQSRIEQGLARARKLAGYVSGETRVESSVTQLRVEPRKDWVEAARDLSLKLKERVSHLQDPLDFHATLLHFPAEMGPVSDDWSKAFLYNPDVHRMDWKDILLSVKRIFIRGPLGIGKTSLVRNMVQQEEVRRHFDGGVHWLHPDPLFNNNIRHGLSVIFGIPDLKIKPVDGQRKLLHEEIRRATYLLIIEEPAPEQLQYLDDLLPEGCTVVALSSNGPVQPPASFQILELASPAPKAVLELLDRFLSGSLKLFSRSQKWELAVCFEYNLLALELFAKCVSVFHLSPDGAFAQIRNDRVAYDYDSPVMLAYDFCCEAMPTVYVNLLYEIASIPTRFVFLEVLEAVHPRIRELLPTLLDAGLVGFDRNRGYFFRLMFPEFINYFGDEIHDPSQQERIAGALIKHIERAIYIHRGNDQKLYRTHDLLIWLLNAYVELNSQAVPTYLGKLSAYLYRNGFWEDFERALRHAASETRDSALKKQWLEHLMLIYYHSERYHECLEITEKLVQKAEAPDQKQILIYSSYVAGKVYHALGNIDNAMKAYEDAFNFAGNNPKFEALTYFCLGQLKFDIKQYEEAHKWFQEAQKSLALCFAERSE